MMLSLWIMVGLGACPLIRYDKELLIGQRELVTMTRAPYTRWFYRAAIVGAVGAFLNALFTAGYLFPFSIGGRSCFCEPPTYAVAWMATLLSLFIPAIAAIFVAGALGSNEPFSLEKHWVPAVMAAAGFLVAGGTIAGASIRLAGLAPLQAIELMVGACLLALSAPLAYAGRVRSGAAVGAVGAALIGVAGFYPLITGYGPLMIKVTWETITAVTMQVSLIGHPLVMFSVAAVLALLAAGVPRKAVSASAAAPPAILAITSFMMVANLIRWELKYPIYGSVPEQLMYSVLLRFSLVFIGPTLLGVGGAIAAAAVIAALRSRWVIGD